METDRGFVELGKGVLSESPRVHGFALGELGSPVRSPVPILLLHFSPVGVCSGTVLLQLGNFGRRETAKGQEYSNHIASVLGVSTGSWKVQLGGYKIIKGNETKS